MVAGCSFQVYMKRAEPFELGSLDTIGNHATHLIAIKSPTLLHDPGGLQLQLSCVKLQKRPGLLDLQGNNLVN